MMFERFIYIFMLPRRYSFIRTVKLLIKTGSQIEAGSLIQAGGLSRLFYNRSRVSNRSRVPP